MSFNYKFSYKQPGNAGSVIEEGETYVPAPDSGSDYLGLVSNVSGNSIDLEWDFVEVPEPAHDGFIVERKAGFDGEYIQIATPIDTARTYTDSGLDWGTLYTYRVRATDAGVESPNSNESQEITGSINAPYGATLTLLDFNSLTLDWKWLGNEANIDGFQIEINNLPRIEVNNPALRTHQFDGVNPDTPYEFRVRANSGGSYSGWSAYSDILQTPAASAIDDLAINDISLTTMDLVWTEPSQYAISYSIYDNSDDSLIDTVAAPATGYQVQNLQDNTAYSFYAIVNYEGSESVESNIAGGTTLKAEAIDDLTVSSFTHSTITLAWTEPSVHATSYNIYDASDDSLIGSVAAPATEYEVQGLTELTTYSFYVRADYDGLESADSNVVSETTAEALGFTELDSLTSVNLDGVFGVAISDSTAFVTSSVADSITAIDISNPSALVELDSLTSANLDGARGVAISGSTAFVTSHTADSITAIDISNPSALVELDSLTSVNIGNARGVAISGSTAFVTSYTADRITAIDISNPSALVELDSLTSVNLDGARGVAISGSTAFVTSSMADSITAIDISNPSALVELDSLTSVNLDGALGVAISDSTAFVASYTADSITAVSF